MEVKKNKRLITLGDIFYMTMGAIISGIGINVFLIPNKIVTGGFTGLSTVLYYLFEKRISVGALMLIMNIVIFVLGYKFMNKKTIIKSIYGTVVFSLSVDITKSLIAPYLNRYLYNISNVNTDMLLYSLFGGALLGAGIGIIINCGGTTGGVDFLSKIITHFLPRLSLSKLFLVSDTIIISISALLFGNIIYSLYGIITVVTLTTVLNLVLERNINARGVIIVSDYPDELSKCILRELDCGLTILNGKNGYRENDTKVLFCVLYKNNLEELHEKMTAIDPKAFMIHTDVSQVFGRGFSLKR